MLTKIIETEPSYTYASVIPHYSVFIAHFRFPKHFLAIVEKLRHGDVGRISKHEGSHFSGKKLAINAVYFEESENILLRKKIQDQLELTHCLTLIA